MVCSVVDEPLWMAWTSLSSQLCAGLVALQGGRYTERIGHAGACVLMCMHHATESQANARCARARAGNGSQWSKMAQPLLRSSAVFRRAIQACAEAVAPHGLNLLAEFEAEGGWSQPAIAMVGLVAVQARGRTFMQAARGSTAVSP